MQRRCFIPALAALAVALALPAVAPAAPVVKGPPTFHERVVEDFVADDFCGTGESVSVQIERQETVWEGEDAFKVVLNEKVLFTHDGVTLVAQSAGRVLGIFLPAQEGAAQTVEIVETGLRARLKLPNGGVLTSDHGLLHYIISFDEDDEVVDVEILRDRGGHPAFASDVFCQAATAAFGLD
jgi:hypothetical protein